MLYLQNLVRKFGNSSLCNQSPCKDELTAECQDINIKRHENGNT